MCHRQYPLQSKIEHSGNAVGQKHPDVTLNPPVAPDLIVNPQQKAYRENRNQRQRKLQKNIRNGKMFLPSVI